MTFSVILKGYKLPGTLFFLILSNIIPDMQGRFWEKTIIRQGKETEIIKGMLRDLGCAWILSPNLLRINNLEYKKSKVIET